MEFKIEDARVNALIDSITAKKNDISKIIDGEILGNRMNEVIAHYDGDAAKQYQEDLKDLSLKVSENIDLIISTMKRKLDEERAAHAATDSALAGN